MREIWNMFLYAYRYRLAPIGPWDDGTHETFSRKREEGGVSAGKARGTDIHGNKVSISKEENNDSYAHSMFSLIEIY